MQQGTQRGTGTGTPTLTLLNWEVAEASLSAPFPAARVFLSSAAGSAGATHISSPLMCTPSPSTPWEGAGGRIWPNPPPHRPGKHQPKQEVGRSPPAPGGSGCQIMPTCSPKIQPSLGCSLLVGVRQKGAEGLGGSGEGELTSLRGAEQPAAGAHGWQRWRLPVLMGVWGGSRKCLSAGSAHAAVWRKQ